MVDSVKRGKEIKKYQNRNVIFVRLKHVIIEEPTNDLDDKQIDEGQQGF